MTGSTRCRIFVSVALLVAVAVALDVDLSAQDRFQQLDQRIARVEAQLQDLLAEVQQLRKERAQLDLAEKPPQPKVDLDSRGLQVETPKRDFSLQISGGFQVDARNFLSGRTVIGGDTLLIRRARPNLILKAGKFGFRLTPDFAGASASLYDAYLSWTLTPYLQLRAGKMKSPLGLERLQSATALGLAERGLPSELLPNRDVGVMLQASLLDKRVDFNLGLFNGAPDGSNLFQDFDEKKDLVARVFTLPFRNGTLARGLGIGIAGSYGQHLGLARIYQTTTLQPFFKFAPDTIANGTSWRVVPQAYYYQGPFGVIAEWAASSQEMALGQRMLAARNSAWQVTGSLVLTGEAASYGGVDPASDFEPGSGKFGAFELVLRAGRLNLDSDIFPDFADERLSARRATGFGAGLNWYLSREVRLLFDYETTGFVPFLRPVDREHAIITRMQFAY